MPYRGHFWNLIPTLDFLVRFVPQNIPWKFEPPLKIFHVGPGSLKFRLRHSSHPYSAMLRNVQPSLDYARYFIMLYLLYYANSARGRLLYFALLCLPRPILSLQLFFWESFKIQDLLFHFSRHDSSRTVTPVTAKSFVNKFWPVFCN